MQIDHISIPVADLAAARAFYEQALAPLGVQLVAEFPSGIALGGGQGHGILGVTPGHPCSRRLASAVPDANLRSEQARS